MVEHTVRFRVEGIHAHGQNWRVLYLCGSEPSDVMLASEELRITVSKLFAANFEIGGQIELTFRKTGGPG